MEWQYGITTVPSRKNNLLKRTIASLKLAGFVTPRLFVDGGRGEDYENFGLEYTLRSNNVSCMGNWHSGMVELYHRNPWADRYAMFEDDFVTYKHLKEYLELIPYPHRGYLNLLTFRENEEVIRNKPFGFHKAAALRGGEILGGEPQTVARGAVALVFSNEAIVALLSSMYMFSDSKNGLHGWRRVDGRIADSLAMAGWREYIHNPSLVQHTGDITTLPGNYRHPYANSFISEDFDARELLC